MLLRVSTIRTGSASKKGSKHTTTTMSTPGVEKAAIDKRTNSYTLTSTATAAMDDRQRWEIEQVGRIDAGDPSPSPEAETHS